MTVTSSDAAGRAAGPGTRPSSRSTCEGQQADPRSRTTCSRFTSCCELDQMASFELTLNNWDDKLLAGSSTPSRRRARAFRVGNRPWRSSSATRTSCSPVLSGHDQLAEPRLPGRCPPTIGSAAPTACRSSRTASRARASRSTTRQDRLARSPSRSPSGTSWTSTSTRTGPTYELVVQKNQDDASFLMERAKRIDYDCYMPRDEARGDADAALRPPDRRPRRTAAARVPAGLRARAGGGQPGRGTAARAARVPNLIEFTPTLTTAGQVSRLTVRGWDPRTKQSMSVGTRPPTDLPQRPGRRAHRAGRGHRGARPAGEEHGDRRAGGQRRGGPRAGRSAAAGDGPTSSSPAPAGSPGCPSCACGTCWRSTGSACGSAATTTSPGSSTR